MQNNIDASSQYCETNKATILVYRDFKSDFSDFKTCACCHNPPEEVYDYSGINMYQNEKSKIFRQLSKSYSFKGYSQE